MNTYRNPPIKEALCDIKVNLPPETTMKELKLIEEKVKQRFPMQEEKFSWQSKIEFKAGEPPEILTPSSGPNGYLFRSDENGKVLQSRLDGFTFNKLKPYESWNAFRDESKELWHHYVTIAKPQNVTRLALRYINRIEIPLPFDDFKEFILTIPDIPSAMPQMIAKLFMQLVIPNEQINAIANITETFEAIEEKRNILPFILDIDVYRNVNLRPQDKEIWKIFEELRDYKNLIFKESITQKCEELFR